MQERGRPGAWTFPTSSCTLGGCLHPPLCLSSWAALFLLLLLLQPEETAEDGGGAEGKDRSWGKSPMPSSPMPPCPLLPQVPAPQPGIRCLETKDLVPDWPGDLGYLTCYYRAGLLPCRMGSGQKSLPMGLVCTSVSSQSDRQTDMQARRHTHSHPPTHIPSHTHTFTCASAHAFTYICACTWPLACCGCSRCPIFYFSFSDSDPSPRRPISFLIPIAPPPLHLSFIMSSSGGHQQGKGKKEEWDGRGELQWGQTSDPARTTPTPSQVTWLLLRFWVGGM